MKRKLKVFDANRGLQLDATFESHVANGCERCRQFDATKPATAALMCLEGAVIYKRDNVTRPRSVTADRPDNFATKAQMKAAIRYKGDPA